MAQMIKDYGSLISPTLAFILGIIAVLIKIKLDNGVQKKHTAKYFNKSIDMLSKIELPEFEENPIPLNERNDGGIFHASMARKLTDLSRMRFSLSSVYKYLQNLESDVTKSVDLLMWSCPR